MYLPTLGGRIRAWILGVGCERRIWSQLKMKTRMELAKCCSPVQISAPKRNLLQRCHCVPQHHLPRQPKGPPVHVSILALRPWMAGRSRAPSVDPSHRSGPPSPAAMYPPKPTPFALLESPRASAHLWQPLWLLDLRADVAAPRSKHQLTRYFWIERLRIRRRRQDQDQDRS